MAFPPPELPYSPGALAPFLSRETIEIHHGRHHKGYVDRLNALLPGSGLEGRTIEQIVRSNPPPALFNPAAQAWNHAFYWGSLAPTAGGEPKGAIGDAIRTAFGGFGPFKAAFTEAAVTLFGSGWAWLVRTAEGRLAITTTKDAGCPLTSGQTPLLTCDVWEHAYYIDYRNARPAYVEAFWGFVNWDFADRNLRA